MFLKTKIKRPKTIGIKITLWFACLIIFCQVIFFVTTYFFLSSILRERDQSHILTEAGEISLEFKSEGLKGFYSFINYHLSSRLKEVLFIRVASENNKTLFIFTPESTKHFKLDNLTNKIPKNSSWMTLKNKDNDLKLDIYTQYISDNNILQVGMSNYRRNIILNKFKKIFILGFSPFILLALAGAAFVSTRFLRPVRDIINTVKSIDMGQMDSRVERTYNHDELDELSKLFNQMLERIEKLIKGMKDSLDNVAHDLRTPLTRLKNTAELAIKNFPDQKLSLEAHENALEESERILKILETIMDITESETGIMNIRYEKTDLYELLFPVFDLYSYVAEEKNIKIKMNIEKGININVDPRKISQVFANIIDNAVKFSHENSVIEIDSSQTKKEVLVSIKDHGPGINKDDINQIFDRLYRGENTNNKKGLGIGLSIVKAIVKAHNGKIYVDSAPFEETVFTITLPL